MAIKELLVQDASELLNYKDDLKKLLLAQAGTE
jgi:hypothetical protein